MKKIALVSAALVIGFSGTAHAGQTTTMSDTQLDRVVAGQASIDAPVNKSTDIHHAPGNTPGFGGSSANPNGGGVNGGNGIHNIAGAPGQGGANEADDRPAGNMHGGLAANTGYAK